MPARIVYAYVSVLLKGTITRFVLILSSICPQILVSTIKGLLFEAFKLNLVWRLFLLGCVLGLHVVDFFRFLKVKSHVLYLYCIALWKTIKNIPVLEQFHCVQSVFFYMLCCILMIFGMNINHFFSDLSHITASFFSDFTLITTSLFSDFAQFRTSLSSVYQILHRGASRRTRLWFLFFFDDTAFKIFHSCLNINYE